MSIESALETALSGLRATQAQIQVISGNIANVQTPGYSRQILPQLTVVTANATGVDTGAVQRVIDPVLNANLINQTTTASAATTLATYYKQIEGLFGQVGSGATINEALNQFSSALHAVATTPQDPVAQGAAVSAGQSLAQMLNQVSAGIQNIRQGADTAISSDITTLNAALQSISRINQQVSQLKAEGQSTASLEDQRDEALNQVAQLIGVNSFVTSNGSMVVLTSSGETLVDPAGAGVFTYTPAGNVNASTNLSAIKLNGIDITATGKVDSGALGTLLQLRDTDLTGLTAQVNQFTNNLFNATVVSSASLTFNSSGGNPAAGDTFTAVIDGSTYATAPLPANPTMLDVANALTAQFKARASVAMNGGPPLAGDSFTATIDGNSYTTAALAGAGLGSADIVKALNAKLNSVDIPVTLNTPAAGDKFDVTVNGTTYTTAGLAGPGPFALTDIANAVQAALPARYTATVVGGNIEIGDTQGQLQSASIALNSGTGTETFGAGSLNTTFSAGLDSGGNIVVADAAGNPITLNLAKAGGPGSESFASAQYTTLSATVSAGNILITDSSGNPLSGTLSANPMFTAGTIVNGANTTLDFTPTSSSLNVGQTFDVTVGGTDFGTTTALATGAITLNDVATAVQALFTAQGASFTATVAGGKLRITGPLGSFTAANTAVVLNGGPGSETFTSGIATGPLQTLNSTLGPTNDAHHFFAAVDLTNGLDNAATIQVNPSLIANASLLLNGASGPDPAISQNLFGNLSLNYTFNAAGSFTNATTTTLGNYSAQIVAQAASTSAAAQSEDTFQSQLQSQIAAQAGSVSGVNIDEELGNLIQYQNTYGANARVLTTIQALYDTLMRM